MSLRLELDTSGGEFRLTIWCRGDGRNHAAFGVEWTLLGIHSTVRTTGRAAGSGGLPERQPAPQHKE